MTELLKLFGVPEPASRHAGGIDDLVGYVHLLMLALFVGWLGYYLLALFKFRKGANPKADYVGVKSHISSYLEVGVAVVEAVLLIGFAIPLWARAVDQTPTDADKPVKMQIMGMQFKWNAHFIGSDNKWARQDIELVNQGNPFGIDFKDAAAKDDAVCLAGEPFKLPINRPVLANVSSMDVIHCWKSQSMRVTQDAIPGMSIPIHFTPTKLGKFSVTCAQLCGSGHSKMSGEFEVVSQEDWDKWYVGKAKEAAAGGGGFE